MWRTKKAPGLATQGSFRCFVWLDGADAASARTLGARLDLEGHLLATAEAVEVTFGATPVEEEFLTVFGCDKAEATVRDQFLDGACGHFHLLSLELGPTQLGGPVREKRACGERLHCAGIKSIPQTGEDQSRGYSAGPLPRSATLRPRRGRDAPRARPVRLGEAG